MEAIPEDDEENVASFKLAKNGSKLNSAPTAATLELFKFNTSEPLEAKTNAANFDSGERDGKGGNFLKIPDNFGGMLKSPYKLRHAISRTAQGDVVRLPTMNGGINVGPLVTDGIADLSREESSKMNMLSEDHYGVIKKHNNLGSNAERTSPANHSSIE